MRLGFPEQDENRLDTVSHRLFEVSVVGNVNADVIIDMDPVRGGLWCAIGAQDNWVNGIGYRQYEGWVAAST